MLTPEGAALLLAIAAGLSSDSVAGTIAVSDAAGASAVAALAAAPTLDGAQLTLIATFGEQAANFEWSVVEVRSAQGVVVDRDTSDNGRKAAGAVWTLETVLELGAGT